MRKERVLRLGLSIVDEDRGIACCGEGGAVLRNLRIMAGSAGSMMAIGWSTDWLSAERASEVQRTVSYALLLQAVTCGAGLFVGLEKSPLIGDRS